MSKNLSVYNNDERKRQDCLNLIDTDRKQFQGLII